MSQAIKKCNLLNIFNTYIHLFIFINHYFFKKSALGISHHGIHTNNAKKGEHLNKCSRIYTLNNYRLNHGRSDIRLMIGYKAIHRALDDLRQLHMVVHHHTLQYLAVVIGDRPDKTYRH